MNTPHPLQTCGSLESRQAVRNIILWFSSNSHPTPGGSDWLGTEWEEAMDIGRGLGESTVSPDEGSGVSLVGGGGGDRPLIYITVPPSQQKLWFLLYSDKARTIPSLRPVTR